MRETTKIIFQEDDGGKFFGEGPARLLRNVEETSSLHQAAQRMGMAYSKAFQLMKNAEAVLGFPLLSRAQGGAKGGGSTLTEEGKAWLTRYETYRDRCQEQNEALYRQCFPELSFGAVILASGLSERFGGNKLLADFRGEPVIEGTIRAGENQFLKRVAVTRNPETAAFLKDRGIETVLHDLPGKNDSVRLGLFRVMEKKVTGCMFFQADQPLLQRESVRKLCLAAAAEPEKIWRLSYENTGGAPVWFPESLFPELLSLPEGAGGASVIKAHPALVRTVEASFPEELTDIDTKEDLCRLNSRFLL